MKEITKIMSHDFKLHKLGYDFAGYTFTNNNQLSAHHLIIPARNGGLLTRDNTVILRQNTSHDYIHLIEKLDYDMFLAITSELIDENISGRLDIDNLRRIRDVLNCFEKEYKRKEDKHGKKLIKREYIVERIKL